MGVLLVATGWLCAVMALAWWVQRRLRNAGWVDAFWTFGLGVGGVCTALAVGEGAQAWLVAAVIGLWALRLGLHIVARSRNAPEDSRYAHFRQEWGAAFEIRMFGFLQIQAAAAAVLLLPVYAAAVSSPAPGWPGALAVLIAAVAIIGEGIADRQLQAFRSDPANHGRVCDQGLWGLSRHPNYVFEWLYWFAYPLMATGSPWVLAALLGPALMYVLLVHVSGIPPLEDQMLRSRGDIYRAYQRRVPAFLPFPKGSRA